MKHFRGFFLFVFFVISSCSGITNSQRQSLVIYSGRSESLVEPLIQRFRDDTGLAVKVRYGGTAELAATLLEEGNASPADIFWAQDPGGLGAVAGAEMFGLLPSDLLDQVPAGFRSTTGDWVGITGRARVLVYNTENVSVDKLPEDLWGLVDPVWIGRIGWAPTNGSLQAMVTGMRTLWGEEKTREWLDRFLENKPVVYEKNTPIVAAVGSGEIDIGLVNHYYLFRFLVEEGPSFPARNYVLPGQGPGSLLMVSGVGILKNSPNLDNARRFIEFLLSDASQVYFAAETFEYPIIEGIPIPDELAPLLELAPTLVDLVDLGDLAGTVQMLQDAGALP